MLFLFNDNLVQLQHNQTKVKLEKSVYSLLLKERIKTRYNILSHRLSAETQSFLYFEFLYLLMLIPILLVANKIGNALKINHQRSEGSYRSKVNTYRTSVRDDKRLQCTKYYAKFVQ